MKKLTRTNAINEKCRDCIYDPLSAGTWLEQIAACESACCALHHFRPMPRQCRKDGGVVREEVKKVRDKLDRINRQLNSR